MISLALHDRHACRHRAVVFLVLTGCATMADVTPGGGRTTEISGFTYDQIWDAVNARRPLAA